MDNSYLLILAFIAFNNNTTRSCNCTFELKQRFLMTLKINDDYCKLIEF